MPDTSNALDLRFKHVALRDMNPLRFSVLWLFTFLNECNYLKMCSVRMRV